MMYSGGWDSQVKFWDIRASQIVHRIGGVQICGESVDISCDGNYVVTGGGYKGEGIKIWDFRDMKAPLRTIWRIKLGLQRLQKREFRFGDMLILDV